MNKSIKLTKKTNKLNKLIKDNRGATMVEYALMLFLILVLAYVGFQTLGSKVKDSATSATSAFTTH
jgi:Flp pilus assembly pilin Flp